MWAPLKTGFHSPHLPAGLMARSAFAGGVGLYLLYLPGGSRPSGCGRKLHQGKARRMRAPAAKPSLRCFRRLTALRRMGLAGLAADLALASGKAAGSDAGPLPGSCGL